MHERTDILDEERGPVRLRVWALLRLGILLALFVWAFRPEVGRLVPPLGASSEAAHATAMPLMAGVVIWSRRKALAGGLTQGSLWGVVFVAAGLGLYAAATWPFSYGYVRDVAIVPVLAGIILVTCGRRVLMLSGGVLLLVLLAIPIGSRLYASLIIRPETLTIAGVGRALDLLPGVSVTQKGVDLFFHSARGEGVVALGESNRGAQLLLAFAAIGVFVTFVRERTFGRLVFVALAAAPIVLVVNYSRLLLWGLVTIYGQAGPTEGCARDISAVCSILIAYVLFAAACSLRIRLFVEDEPTDGGSVEDTRDE